MKVQSLNQQDGGIDVVWSDDSSSFFPYVWLRDNDQSDLHPHTRERTFDLTGVSIDLKPRSCALHGQVLELQWEGKDRPSAYAAEWLHRHRPGRQRPDPARIRPQFWGADDPIVTMHAAACASSSGLLELLTALKRHGLVVVEALPDEEQAGESFGDAIGFKRPSNFGSTFEVVSKPDPNNLAYTSIALPLHTDLPNQALIPGYQFLHCIANQATGGESTFADGFHVCDQFRAEFPAFFEILSRVPIPFRFHDDTSDIRSRRCVIALGDDGEFEALSFNAHIADVPDLPAEQLVDFYAAYQSLMKLLRDPRFTVRYRLNPGEMVIFDNRRVLHGRQAFDSESGLRHLRGYYIDATEVDSRLRVLARNP